MAVCSVDGCRGRVTGRGWCAKHYWRMRTYGDLDHVREYPPIEERFWGKVDRSGACWLWTAGADQDGYGVFSVLGRQRRAHRFSWELEHDENVPPGMCVMHTCDVPACVNPAHLRLGTTAENSADSARKARRPRGSRQHAAKLTEGQVLDLRARYAAGGVTQKQLAADYGISRALVSVIVTRKAWSHI
jgi:hypothetical protein